MQLRLKNATLHKTEDGLITSRFSNGIVADNSKEYVVFPGFADVHVHLREPGFSYKETIATGTSACAAGGYTDVCSMPNLKPVPDSVEHLQEQLNIIDKDAVIRVHPFGAITVGEQGGALADLQGMANAVAGYSDDGRGVQNGEMMLEAMKQAASLGKVIAAHCEDNSLLNGGYIHAGEYAAAHGHKGIVSESEWGPIARDIELVKQSGCAYHVCHVSTKESVEIIRKAKAAGVNITCETAPHYLVMSDKDLQENARFKMNPPLRSEEDRLALIEGIKDGTIDVIATDHAPHSFEEKAKGLANSMMGVVGIETAFPVMYTYLVKTGVITLDKLLDLMVYAPRKRFGLPLNPERDFCVYDLNNEYTVNPAAFLSKGRSTPFEGWKVQGKCLLTVCDGQIAYQHPDFEWKE
ncbi:MAG: dihydroorotase [Clostridia bacterium]|nr:dihydroorotase [Clostridia bacterium]